MFNNPNEQQKKFNATVHSALQLMQLAPIIMQAELSDAQRAAIKERMLLQKTSAKLECTPSARLFESMSKARMDRKGSARSWYLSQRYVWMDSILVQGQWHTFCFSNSRGKDEPGL